MEATDPLFDLNVPLEALGLSPVGGEAAAEPRLATRLAEITKLINEPDYEVLCLNIAQKQELFEYARGMGLPIAQHPLRGPAYRDDEDLLIGPTCNGLISYPSGACIYKRISASQFKAMCNDYGASHSLSITHHAESH